jgi:osmotically-inducible protein OsmY
MSTTLENDIAIQRDILDELDWIPGIQSVDVGVEVENGIATFTGTVDSYWKKKAAEQAAQRVFGVRAVANDVDVSPPASGDWGDTDIATVSANRFDWSMNVPRDRVDITVDHGQIILSGDVDWPFQRAEAEHLVSDIAGVRGVTNEIVVKVPHYDEAEIARKIEHAFHRHAILDAQSISVDLHDQVVTLRGTVSSWFERQEAERVAWGPGVERVENELRVVP